MSPTRTNAAVGGKAGKLIISTTANITPDTTKPTGTISGPATGKTGEALTFTATLADEAGGSGINAGGDALDDTRAAPTRPATRCRSRSRTRAPT